MGSCDINHLKALTLQSSPETIWHIIVEQKLIFQILFIFKNCNEILILNKEIKIKMKIINN